MTNDEQKKADADLQTLSALLMVVFLATLLMGLIAMILPAVLGIFRVVTGLGWFSLLHYAVWGWWLGRHLKPDVDAETRSR